MGNVIDIEENLPHEISELICLKCFHRWIGVYPERTRLKKLECTCGEIGYVIKTGQTLPDLPREEMTNDARYQNLVRIFGEEKGTQMYREYFGK